MRLSVEHLTHVDLFGGLGILARERVELRCGHWCWLERGSEVGCGLLLDHSRMIGKCLFGAACRCARGFRRDRALTGVNVGMVLVDFVAVGVLAGGLVLPWS